MSDAQTTGCVLLGLAWFITWVTLLIYGDETLNWEPVKRWGVMNIVALWVAGLWLVIPG